MIAQRSVAELRERTNLSNVHAVAFLRVCDGSVERAIGLFEVDPNMMNDIGLAMALQEEPAAAADEPAPPAPARPHHTRSPFALAARARAKHRRRKESHLLRAAGVDLQHRPDQHVSERRRQRTKDVAFARGMAAERELSKQRRGAKRKSKKQAKAQRRADQRAARRRAAAQ